MIMRLRTLALLALATVLLGGCCRCKQIQQKNYGKPLVGTQWHLTQLDGKEMARAEGKFNITFAEDGRISGVGDCNRLGGSFSQHDVHKQEGKIKIGQLISTRAFCPDQATEDKFMKMLIEVDSYKLDVYLLIMYKGNDMVAVFEADKWK